MLFAFNGGIASTPTLDATPTTTDPTLANTVVRNFVRGWQPAPFPMRITSLKGTVSNPGHIKVDGRGLLVAGGDQIGTNGGLQAWASVLCGSEWIHTSVFAATPLSDAGDFSIDADLMGDVPASCESPLLLIRDRNRASWLAVGLLVRAGVSTDASSYAIGQTIQVSWSGLTTSSTNWVAYAPEGSPETTVTRWTYTGGAATGSFTFEGPLAPGRYVARTFADDSYSKTYESAPFVVQ
jgi:hypothetical protein